MGFIDTLEEEICDNERIIDKLKLQIAERDVTIDTKDEVLELLNERVLDLLLEVDRLKGGTNNGIYRYFGGRDSGSDEDYKREKGIMEITETEAELAVCKRDLEAALERNSWKKNQDDIIRDLRDSVDRYGIYNGDE